MQNNVPSYVDWYGSPANDTYGGDYAGVFNTTFNGANADPAPAAILTSVATGEDSNLAFILLNNVGLVHGAHRLRRFNARTGVAHPNNDHVLATLGDVFPGGANTIVFPGTLFHRTNQLNNVRTAISINAAILADPDATQALEVDPPDPPADFSPARTRAAMMIPPHIVAPILAASVAPGGLSPRDLWTQFVRSLLNDPVAFPMCGPFIDWCRVAYSHGIAALNTLAVAIPGNVRLDNIVAANRNALLRQDLPARFAAPAITGGTLAAVVQELGGMRADAAQQMQAATLRADQQAAAAVLPSKRWGISVDRLLRLCHANDKNDLPEVWLSMAKTHTKMDNTTIQTLLDRDMPELGASGRRYAGAVCSSDLAKQLGNLQFQTDDPDAIDIGLSIFSICYPTQASASATSYAAGLYDSMLQQVSGLTLEDTIKLQATQKFLLPTDMMQLKRVCWAYHHLLAVVLGMDHCITAAFGEFVEAFMECESILSDVFSNVYSSASLLRFVQLRMHKCAKAQMANAGDHLGAPSFTVVFDELDEQCWIPPTMPAQYLQPSIRAAPPSMAPPAFTPQSQTVPPLAGEFKVREDLLDREQVPVRKNFPSKRYMDKHGHPPHNNQGKAMCLLFHVPAACKHECPRAHDHYHHSPDESLRLAAYLALGNPIPEARGVGSSTSGMHSLSTTPLGTSLWPVPLLLGLQP